MNRYAVEKILETDRLEQFRDSGGNREIVFHTNRRLFQLKGLKHRQGTWTVIHGTLNNQSAFAAITESIEVLYP
jgi:hypothetical protein